MMPRPAKPLMVREGPTSPARAWFSWWARHRLPLLSSRRLYITDLDAAVWALFDYARDDRLRLLALLEVTPWNGNLDARRASLAVLRELGRRAGLLTLVVEVSPQCGAFRVRTPDAVLVFLGGDEKEFTRWLLHAIETHQEVPKHE